MNKKNMKMIAEVMLIVITVIFVSGCTQKPNTSSLSFMFAAYGDNIDIINNYVHEDDFILIGYNNVTSQLLDKIQNGIKMINARSSSVFKENIEEIRDIKPEYLSYNIETTGDPSLLTEEERTDPVAAIEDMYHFAHENGFKLALAPTHDLIEEHGLEIAKYADLFGIQCQKFQVDSPASGNYPNGISKEDFRKNSERLIQIVREASPDIPIVVQIATYPREGKPGGREVTLEEMKTVTTSISDLVDGICVLFTPETINTWEQYIEWLRSDL